ncbi:MAG: helix-turn-helix transcriptional regulator [Acidobacteria bacterium]|jgi:DNA-binding PadR family transcriptional regulator|nr:helix-turn-helix transcriptional regulator [Acidobacteriota bacterium]
MVTDHKNPLSFLPLTPFAFQVLLALADSDRHGYAIIKEVEERSGGTLKLRTGTLYTLLQRLVQEGLIGEADAKTDEDSRRRNYQLTALGDAVLRAEALRLEALIGDARRKHVLDDAGGI